jgi:hypothetical protein
MNAARQRRQDGGRRGAHGGQARAAEEGEGLGDHVEHLECNEQCLFLIFPILVYFLYKFDSTIPNFCIYGFCSIFVLSQLMNSP